MKQSLIKSACFVEGTKVLTSVGQTPIENISVGDVLITQGGDLEYITSVSNERLLEPIRVFNFEVRDWHTYYVSDSNILVHNTCSLKFVRKSASQIEKNAWS